jgi:outer membrane protein
MKIFIRQSCAIVVLVASAMVPQVQAQEFRVGFVNTDRILKESAAAKAAGAKLEQEFSKREKDLVDQGAALKALADKLEREAPTLSESQRAARQKQLVDQDRDLQRKRREAQEDLNSRRNEELQMVFERANKVVKQIAETEKYDLVLQEPVVYINPKHDITDKVIRALNTGAK